MAASSFFFARGVSFLYLLALISFFSILQHISASPTAARPHFEGFDADEDEDLEPDVVPPLLRSPSISLSTSTPVPDPAPSQIQSPSSDQSSNSSPKPASTSSFEYWDEDEFEGVPLHQNPPESASQPDPISDSDDSESDPKAPKRLSSYSVEIACVSFLIVFLINYFTGKRENENLALAWVSNFAAKDSIFDRNFSLLGVGETNDSPLLLKEGQNVFKFYATGRRFCSGLLATMDLKSRHDLISRLYNMVVPCKDEITFEVYMNDEAMDQVVLALARKKLAKTMHKEMGDLQRFSGLVPPQSGRKWVSEELQVVAESKEIAGDMITDVVLDQVFGDKAFEKFAKGFISMHLSDQHVGPNKKMLVLKFALPDATNMADMTRLVALVPYYIDLIGRYKLSSHARSKTEAARSKVAQEMYKELEGERQEALQKKKAEQRKKLEEAESKLSAEGLRKKESRERARQMKKAKPKLKMTRAH